MGSSTRVSAGQPILLAVMLSVSVAVAGDDSAVDSFVKGVDLHSKGDYEQAAVLFEAAVRADGDVPDYHFWLGATLVKQLKAYRRAIAVLGELESQPARFWSARAYLSDVPPQAARASARASEALKTLRALREKGRRPRFPEIDENVLVEIIETAARFPDEHDHPDTNAAPKLALCIFLSVATAVGLSRFAFKDVLYGAKGERKPRTLVVTLFLLFAITVVVFAVSAQILGLLPGEYVKELLAFVLRLSKSFVGGGGSGGED